MKELSVVVRNRHGKEITSTEQWGRLAAPAAVSHWKDGRSAKELAKAWIAGDGQRELTQLLDRHPDTSGLRIEEAIAEAQVGFDAFPGGKRNHDLLIRGSCASGLIVIGLEAKADETFGQTIASYLRDGLRIRNAGKATNAPERLDGLLKGIAGRSLEEASELGNLRYQLFSGVAGTLAATRGDDLAALVVHEFPTELTTEKRRSQNRADFAAFVKALTGTMAPPGDSWLVGPLHVPAGEWAPIPLYLGHVTASGTAP